MAHLNTESTQSIEFKKFVKEFLFLSKSSDYKTNTNIKEWPE